MHGGPTEGLPCSQILPLSCCPAGHQERAPCKGGASSAAAAFVHHTLSSTLLPPPLPPQLRTQLRAVNGINESTADETTKLLLERSDLQKNKVTLQVELAHKEGVIALLHSQLRCTPWQGYRAEGRVDWGEGMPAWMGTPCRGMQLCRAVRTPHDSACCHCYPLRCSELSARLDDSGGGGADFAAKLRASLTSSLDLLRGSGGGSGQDIWLPGVPPTAAVMTASTQPAMVAGGPYVEGVTTLGGLAPPPPTVVSGAFFSRARRGGCLC